MDRTAQNKQGFLQTKRAPPTAITTRAAQRAAADGTSGFARARSEPGPVCGRRRRRAAHGRCKALAHPESQAPNSSHLQVQHNVHCVTTYLLTGRAVSLRARVHQTIAEIPVNSASRTSLIC
eukprot:COSAG01_NODE_3040_length_6683_cov_19.798755_3_plen_122_part_00